MKRYISAQANSDLATMTKLLKSAHYDTTQKYQLSVATYEWKTGSPSISTVRYTAKGDYWALFGIRLQASVTPNNMLEYFDTKYVQTILDTYPDFNSLLESDVVREWIEPDEYVFSFKLVNYTTGKVLFEYPLEDEGEDWEDEGEDW